MGGMFCQCVRQHGPILHFYTSEMKRRVLSLDLGLVEARIYSNFVTIWNPVFQTSLKKLQTSLKSDSYCKTLQ